MLAKQGSCIGLNEIAQIDAIDRINYVYAISLYR